MNNINTVPLETEYQNEYGYTRPASIDKKLKEKYGHDGDLFNTNGIKGKFQGVKY